MKVPHGESGTVIGVRVFDREEGDELPPASTSWCASTSRQKRRSRWATSSRSPRQQGRHREDPADRGHAVHGRRHPGRRGPQPARRAAPDEHRQILELHLGWLAKQGWSVAGSDEEWKKRLISIHADQAEPDTKVATPVFDGAREDEIVGLLGSSLPTGTASGWSRRRQGEPLRRSLR
jgi:DNA-directed RNA polymerase subunit beta